MITIYALFDPRDEYIRYVGKTSNLKRRLQNHVIPSALSRTRHVAAWLASLRRDGVRPGVLILEELLDCDNWIEAEKRWIALFRSEGNDLCNITDGGEGGATRHGHAANPQFLAAAAEASSRKKGQPGTPHTDESKALISIKSKERWVQRKTTGEHVIGSDSVKQAEIARRVGYTNKGRKLTEEHKEKLRQAKLGKKQSPQHVANRMAGKQAAKEARLLDLDTIQDSYEHNSIE